MLLDPTSPRRERPLDRWYELVIATVDAPPPERIGGRVYVRFDLGVEPIAWRLLRSAHQLVLKAPNV